ncbi:MAG TPA: hypothetical protein VNJ02_01850 [Vicinamibacterales bacterium]|nr:hypothetical protein [Vicinamibacterales bacterium]
MLVEAGQSRTRGTTVPSGPPPHIDEILRDTQLIVRGVVGRPRSYLSPDQRYVFTDYPIERPAILYQRIIDASRHPGNVPGVTLTVLGGSVVINGLTFTEAVGALPSIEPGTDCLLLLSKKDGKLVLAGSYYGAFSVAANVLVPLTRKQGFALEHAGADATRAIRDLVDRLHRQR